jgi:hypothetical protein
MEIRSDDEPDSFMDVHDAWTPLRHSRRTEATAMRFKGLDLNRWRSDAGELQSVSRPPSAPEPAGHSASSAGCVPLIPF